MKNQRLVSSKLLDRKWREQEQLIHKRKLRDVQSAIRTHQAKPYQPTITMRNAKKDAMLERRYTEIERENRILLEKMSNIMQNPKPGLYNPMRVEKASLNRVQRKKELMKITVENQAILRRLQEKQPTYSVTKWSREFNQIAKIRDNMCEFPYEFGDANSKSRFTLTTAQTEAEGYASLPRIGSSQPGMRGQGMAQQSFNTMHQSKSGSGLRYGRGASAGPQRGPYPIIRQAENLDENRVVLYKRSKQLGQGYYLVEISTNQTHLYIAAFDVETDESLLIELPQKKANEIIREFQQDYEQLASSLQVLNKRLVLLNPKFIQQKRVGTAPVLGRDGAGRPSNEDNQQEAIDGLDAADASGLQGGMTEGEENAYHQADDKEVHDEGAAAYADNQADGGMQHQQYQQQQYVDQQ